METIYVLFLALLFLVGFAFVLKDYYREKNSPIASADNMSPGDMGAISNDAPKFIATNREKIYIIAIAVLGVILVLISFICNFLFKRCVILQNECGTLKEEIVELEKTSNKEPSKSQYEQEMERTMDFIEDLIELYDKLD